MATSERVPAGETTGRHDVAAGAAGRAKGRNRPPGRSAELSAGLAWRIVAGQFLATAVMTVGLLPVDAVVAGSVLLGGLIAALPGGYAALNLAATRRPQQAFRIIGGEMGRFVLSAAGFALVFALVEPLAPVALIGMFFGMQSAYLVVPLINDRLRDRRR